jgi:hypothetical protein
MSQPQIRRSQPVRAGSNNNSRLGGRPNFTIKTDPYDRLLEAHQRITGYEARGSGRHVRITCPACGTETLKVSVSRADNGSVLLHAFCGHSPAEVLAALGLTLSDLFPVRDLRTLTPDQRRELSQQSLVSRWHAALNTLRQEATVTLIAANQLEDNKPLADADLTRLKVAALRIFDAQEVLSVR